MKRTVKAAQPKSLSSQMEERLTSPSSTSSKPEEFDGNANRVISTGSTLLDLAISGGRFPEGGLPSGILVEIFGPSGAGKTVMLCQIAANTQKAGGSIMFHDPEARLNRQFARIFGLDINSVDYTVPDTVPEVFSKVRDWDVDKSKVNGVFADSLAALSTSMEMTDKDKMGMRRAKEFSEELRKTCRIITQKDLLMVCSNQVRVNVDAGPFEQRYKTPGGEAIAFYSSLRLRCSTAQKINVVRTINKVEHKRVIGVETEVSVFKSSVWKPYRSAPVYILFDYGIDDIRGNLEFLKKNVGGYRIGDDILGKTLSTAIATVEDSGLEQVLKQEVIKLWNEIEGTFEQDRKPRRDV